MIKLTSSAFAEGEAIPAKYTCDGEDASPPLAWANVPADARNIAIVCEDPDAPGGLWVHWVLYGLPGSVRELPAGLPATETLPIGAKQGTNDFDRYGYGGPCPPPGKAHRYFFRIFAVDVVVTLHPGATRDELLSAMEGHILAQGQLMGLYKR